jgi:hypothetical protein
MQIQSILTNLSLFCKSGLLQTVLFFSSSVCSAGLLCINSSVILFCFNFSFHSYSSSEFHLTLFIFSISPCTFYNFSFLTVSFIFHTERPTRHSLSHFLLYTPQQRFHFAFSSENERPLSKQLKRQLIGNHESVSLTDL